MPAEDIPQLTPAEESRIQKLVDEIPWRDTARPLPPAQPDLDECVSRAVAALRKVGYPSAQAHDTKNVLCDMPEVTADYHAIVVRRADDWAAAVGEAMHYSKKLSSRAIALLVQDGTRHADGVVVARAAVRGNIPPVQVWAMDPEAGTLDMGDGRVIEVV